jgi:adenylate cyclase
VLDVALKEVGVRTSPLGELLAAWLYRRHSETFTVEHRVLHGEDDLERAGIHRRPPAHPPAIVFLDISGYTRLTEVLGDEASAAMPMRLATLVQGAASRHSGRTLKWIGDGVELYFRRPADAVQCSLELRDLVPQADLPGTHVGINAGPVVYENGDFYGRTVNIAARIAAYAEQGQVLVSEDVRVMSSPSSACRPVVGSSGRRCPSPRAEGEERVGFHFAAHTVMTTLPRALPSLR